MLQSRCKSGGCKEQRDRRMSDFRSFQERKAQTGEGSFPFHSPSFSISLGARGRGENLAAAEFGGNAIRGLLFL